MKKFLILRDVMGEKKLFDCLREKVCGLATVVQKDITDVTFYISQEEVKVKAGENDIEDFDLVWIRRASSKFSFVCKAITWVLEERKIPYFDTDRKIQGEGLKLNMLVRLALAGFPVTPSFFCWREKILDHRKEIIDCFGFPMIAKAVQKDRGKGVFLLGKPEDFESVLKKTPKKDHFLFQKFYPNDGDYRILVLGDEIGTWEKRIRVKDKYRNNASLGGREEFYPVEKLPKEWKEISLRSAKLLDLQIAGVDLLVDQTTGKVWLLEVNRCPGFTDDLTLSPELPIVSSFFAKVLKNS